MEKELSYYTFEVGREGWQPSNELEWNVFLHDFNSNKIIIFNIFNNGRFLNCLYKLKNETDFKNFSEEVRSLIMYCFWSKCEYETIITSFPSYISKKELNRINNEDVKYRICVNLECEIKVDAYDQIMLNWDKFINYLWNNKNLIKKNKGAN